MKRTRPPTANMRPDLDAVASIKLPLHWSPDQALAVFQILGALREHLWACYGLEIRQALESNLPSTTPGSSSNLARTGQTL